MQPSTSEITHAVKQDAENKALMWVILMLFTGIIGALVYYFVVKRKLKSTRLEPLVSKCLQERS